MSQPKKNEFKRENNGEINIISRFYLAVVQKPTYIPLGQCVLLSVWLQDNWICDGPSNSPKVINRKPSVNPVLWDSFRGSEGQVHWPSTFQSLNLSLAKPKYFVKKDFRIIGTIRRTGASRNFRYSHGTFWRGTAALSAERPRRLAASPSSSASASEKGENGRKDW